jgi:hypothetical protein
VKQVILSQNDQGWGQLLETGTDPRWLSVQILRIHNHISQRRIQRRDSGIYDHGSQVLKKNQTIGWEIIGSLPILS